MAYKSPPSFASKICSGPVMPAFARNAASMPSAAALAGCRILQLLPSPRNAQTPLDWVPGHAKGRYDLVHAQVQKLRTGCRAPEHTAGCCGMPAPVPVGRYAKGHTHSVYGLITADHRQPESLCRSFPDTPHRTRPPESGWRFRGSWMQCGHHPVPGYEPV